VTAAIGQLEARRPRAARGQAAPACAASPRASADAIGRRRSAGPALLSSEEAAAVRGAYRASLPRSPALEPHLLGVLEDVLESPGSLVRAQLAYGMALRGGVARERALRLAVAVEYFHTASLLFDDLPCMDDATHRRGRPCAHVVWGEAAAVLGALALIARGYELLWQAISGLSGARRSRAAALVSECLGAGGVLDGQARDLHFGAAAPTADRVLEVAEGKTVPMIRLTLLLPALTGRAGASSVEGLERLAKLWGVAYQVLDDFQDVLMSREESGKSNARDAELARPNLALHAGRDAALARLDTLLRESGGELARSRSLRLRYPQLAAIQGFLAGEANEVRSRLQSATASTSA
jgi:geranylgeranyl pyrophosphate synthase